MILGDKCTRHCSFCAVNHEKPWDIETEEPRRIISAIKELGIKYVVITSVTRDDLADGGAGQFARVITAIRDFDPNINIEVLTPDFQGDFRALKVVLDATPTVFSHNLETVARLYPKVRPEADYKRSLMILKQAKSLKKGILTKSGIMLGLGEARQEVIDLMHDLRKADCDLLTIGQYLQPTLNHHAVDHYLRPQEYQEFEIIGKKMGFLSVRAGPLVRSSFHAANVFDDLSSVRC